MWGGPVVHPSCHGAGARTVGEAPSPLPPVTMAAEAWASPKLGFQEMYLCIELLALTDTQLCSVGVQAADTGCCHKGARLEPWTWAVGLGCPGLWGVLGHGFPQLWGVVHLGTPTGTPMSALCHFHVFGLWPCYPV